MEFHKWEYSKAIDIGETNVPVEMGIRTLKIGNAFYDDEKYQYVLEVEDIENGAKFKLSYWLQNVEKKMDPTTKAVETVLTENKTSNKTMASLGKALYGDEYDPTTDGILAPIDVIGRIVVADVKPSKPDNLGRTYPRVYSFAMAHEADSWASEEYQLFR